MSTNQHKIKEKVTADVKDLDSGNVDISGCRYTDRDTGTGGVCYTDAGTRVTRTGYVDHRENVNHIGALDHISIYDLKTKI